MRENDERRTDDLFLFLYETVFWLLSRGVVIAPRRRRRARAFPSSRARASSMGDVSWSFACLNRFLFLYLREQFLVVVFVSTSEKMTDLFLFLFLCVFYSLSLSSFETGCRRDGQFSFSNESLDKSRAQLFRGRFT